LAADIAALLGERDLARGAGRDADLRTRIEILHGRPPGAHDIDRGALERVRRAASQLRAAVAGSRERRRHDATAGELLALAYPDRIGRRRGDDALRYALSNGRGA